LMSARDRHPPVAARSRWSAQHRDNLRGSRFREGADFVGSSRCWTAGPATVLHALARHPPEKARRHCSHNPAPSTLIRSKYFSMCGCPKNIDGASPLGIVLLFLHHLRCQHSDQLRRRCAHAHEATPPILRRAAPRGAVSYIRLFCSPRPSDEPYASSFFRHRKRVVQARPRNIAYGARDGGARLSTTP